MSCLLCSIVKKGQIRSRHILKIRNVKSQNKLVSIITLGHWSQTYSFWVKSLYFEFSKDFMTLNLNEVTFYWPYFVSAIGIVYVIEFYFNWITNQCGWGFHWISSSVKQIFILNQNSFFDWLARLCQYYDQSIHE